MKRLRILLADDNEAMLEEVRALLELDFEIVEAVKDGQELIEATERLGPDILIVDISMPVLSGIKAVERLKKDVSNGPKIIFLTVHQDSSLQKAAFAVGAQAYVVKMSAGEDLRVAIDEVLQGRTFVSPNLRSSP